MLGAPSPEVVGLPAAAGLDGTKLVLAVTGPGVSGYDAGDWLGDGRRLAVELADDRRVLALLPVAADEETVGQLLQAVRAVAGWAGRQRGKPVRLPRRSELGTE